MTFFQYLWSERFILEHVHHDRALYGSIPMTLYWRRPGDDGDTRVKQDRILLVGTRIKIFVFLVKQESRIIILDFPSRVKNQGF